MVALLERQLRMLLLAKEHLADGGKRIELPTRLGVPPFVADQMVRQLAGWSAASLERALVDLLACDYSLKSSKLEDEIEMTRLVMRLGRLKKTSNQRGGATLSR